ncbi:MAG: dihydroneopterin aldolase [Bacteroidota bacterium]
MGLIALEGMRFFTNHGVYEEEQRTGTEFIVDVYIETAYDEAAATDDLAGTINYETIFLICQTEMRKQAKLIEHLIQRIIERMKHQFATIQEIKIRIRKLNPMPGVRVDSAYIEESENFVSQCPRCGSPFICYNDGSCWCQEKRIHPKTLANLQQQYQGCLCQNCLDFYAG